MSVSKVETNIPQPMLTKRKFLLIPLALNFILISGFVIKKYRQSISSASYAIDNWNLSNDVQNFLPIDSNDIVFVGTSITEGFPLNELYPGIKIKNRGISGNETRHILGRINPIYAGHPKEIILESGINDLIGGKPVNAVYDNIEKIVKACDNFKIQLLIQSVYPVCKIYAEHQPKIDSLNFRLKILCKNRGITYIDVCSSLKKNGTLNSDLTFDGLHLNANGYKIVKKDLDPYIIGDKHSFALK